MRATYRVLALLIAVGVVVQAAAIAYAMFQVRHAADAGAVFDKNTEANAGEMLHSTFGMMVIPSSALVLLIVSFFARLPGGIRWAGIVLGLVVLQIALAFVSFAAPVVGVLHALNAFALAGVASIAARKSQTAGTVAPLDTPVAAV